VRAAGLKVTFDAQLGGDGGQGGDGLTFALLPECCGRAGDRPGGVGCGGSGLNAGAMRD